MIKLNCDLGESFGAWQMGMDHAVIPHIDMANIACGFHAGDANVMAATLKHTGECKTEIGAHPGYPDLAGFGRRTMHIAANELINLLHYQIAALEGMARAQQQQLSYVKPHGALYNQMMAEPQILTTVMEAVARYPTPLKLMLLATQQAGLHSAQAKTLGIELLFEAFADRRYDNNGHLLSRSQPGAVLNEQQIIEQVEQLVQEGTVTTNTGDNLAIQADTLCVHGDNPESINLIKRLKQLCSQK